jgi:hypothetical protein
LVVAITEDAADSAALSHRGPGSSQESFERVTIERIRAAGATVYAVHESLDSDTDLDHSDDGAAAVAATARHGRVPPGLERSRRPVA